MTSNPQEVGQPGTFDQASAHRTSPVPAFTPGPWTVGSGGSSVDTTAPVRPLRCHGYGCGNTFVCSLNDGEYHEYYDGAEQLANAHLIAAAPALFEALTSLDRLALVILSAVNYADKSNLEAVSNAVKSARTALLLATGGKE